MDQPVITRKTLLGVLILSCCILLITLVFELADRRTKVVFCDVGQGNAEYVRVGDTDILIDAGPANGGALACLGSHMPFFDRTLEYLAISHPQSDHDGATVEILQRYRVKTVLTAAVFRTNPRVVMMQKSSPETRFIFIDKTESIWLTRHDRLDVVAASSLKELPSDNDRSLIVSLITIGRQYLFTGDISATILSALTITCKRNNLVLLVPHHGSGNGLSDFFLRTARPYVAIVSVGSKNPYGHPSPHALELLKRNHIPYRRTDKEGTIVMRE